MQKQLEFIFEKLNDFYINYFIWETMYNIVKISTKADGLFFHYLSMKARFDEIKKSKEDLEARLQEKGFDYISIREAAKEEYERNDPTSYTTWELTLPTSFLEESSFKGNFIVTYEDKEDL